MLHNLENCMNPFQKRKAAVRWGGCLVAWATLLFANSVLSVAAASEVVYRETFNHGRTVEDVGWRLHINADAQDQSDRSAIALAEGKPTDLPGIRSGGPGDELFRGHLYTQAGSSFLLFTEEVRAVGVEEISFYMMLDSTEDRARVAIRQNGQWYVSAQTFSHDALPEQRGMPDGERAVVDFASARWLPLEFEAGSRRRGTGKLVFDLENAPVALEKATIDAAGIFMDSRSGRPRFDTFEVVAERFDATVEMRARELLHHYHPGAYQAPEENQSERWEKMSQALLARGPRPNVEAWQPELEEEVLGRDGRVFYVHPDLGDDANDGNSSAAAFASIQHAISRLEAGDTLVFGPGVYYIRELNIRNMAGTEDRPIYLRAEPRGEAVFSQAWPDAAEGLVEWTDEGNGLYSAPYPTRSAGEDQRGFGGFRDDGDTPWFLFGLRSLEDLLSDGLPMRWDRFRPNDPMPAPDYGFALDSGRAWIKLPNGLDPNGRKITINSHPGSGPMIWVENSPHLIWDGLVFRGAGSRAHRSDRNSPHQVFRNIVVEWCRNGFQPDSHTLVEWCEYTFPGYKRYADELEKLVADAGYRTINPMFGLVKGPYHGALTEGHLAARPWSGRPYEEMRWQPPTGMTLRHCLFYETFDGWNMGWQNSRSYGSVYMYQYDNAVELDAGPTPVRNIHFHDNLILAGHYGTISQFMPVSLDRIEEPLGPQYLYRNVIVGYHNHAWRPWSVSKFWAPKNDGIYWFHNLVWMKSGGLVWQRGHDAEAEESHGNMHWLNNIIVFEEGITHQNNPERYIADGNAFVSPEPREGIIGENGLHFEAMDSLRLKAPDALDLRPGADSPLVGAAVPLPEKLREYHQSETIGPFEPGTELGEDWPRPRRRVFNTALPEKLAGHRADPVLKEIDVVR